MALRTTFRPEAAGKTKAGYELHLGGIVFNALVHNAQVAVGRGPLLLAREITPEQAIKKKLVRIKGNPRLLDRFVRIFRI